MPEQTYEGSIIVTENNQVQENIPFINESDAKDTFLNLCKVYLPRLDYRNSTLIDNLFIQELTTFHNGIITVSRFLRTA